jgi:hypothetical protein
MGGAALKTFSPSSSGRLRTDNETVDRGLVTRVLTAPSAGWHLREQGLKRRRSSLGWFASMPERRTSREIESLVEALIKRLTEAVEAATSARSRVLTDGYLRAAEAEAPGALPVHASPTAEPSPDVSPRPLRARPARPKRPRPAKVAEPKAPPAVDADEERRTAELARMRSILRPAVPTPPTPPVIAPPLLAPEQHGSLQALEVQIRDRLLLLPGLSESRYTAQIAAWVGQVRLIQSGPDGERTRIASRIMFDKLRNLVWSMEAGPIEGLNLSWSMRNWQRYIEENETIAAAPDAPQPPTPEPDAEADVWVTPDEADAHA